MNLPFLETGISCKFVETAKPVTFSSSEFCRIIQVKSIFGKSSGTSIVVSKGNIMPRPDDDAKIYQDLRVLDKNCRENHQTQEMLSSNQSVFATGKLNNGKSERSLDHRCIQFPRI